MLYAKQVLAGCVVVYVLGGILVGSARAEDKRDFVGNTQCKLCHSKSATGQQWKKWNEMKHAKAFETLASEKALEVAKKLGLAAPPQKSSECLQCHVTSYDVEKKAIHAKLKMEHGVQCESCHGPASLHLADGRLVMFKKAELDLSKNMTRPDAKKCAECHNDKNPTWDPEKYTLKDGKKAGFDFEQAYKIIAHPNPAKAKKE